MKQYTFGVAVFPDGSEADEARICKYLEQAHALGCGEVFSSLHIPELGFAKSLAVLGRIAGFAHARGMQVSLDVSGAVASTLLGDEPRRLALCALAPDWVRMDFGFDEQAMLRLVGQLGLPGLGLLASLPCVMAFILWPEGGAWQWGSLRVPHAMVFALLSSLPERFTPDGRVCSFGGRPKPVGAPLSSKETPAATAGVSSVLLPERFGCCLRLRRPRGGALS